MMESQRYPKDFDGIVAGAPAFDWPGLAANGVTIQKALYPNPERLVQTTLDRAALVKLQQAILEQCDAKDGLKDGIVEDPPSAHFDLAKAAGLTDEQRAALGVIYGGVKYDDIFGGHHWTQFCFRMTPDLLLCPPLPFHNATDDTATKND